jgi:hypothetical protein
MTNMNSSKPRVERRLRASPMMSDMLGSQTVRVDHRCKDQIPPFTTAFQYYDVIVTNTDPVNGEPMQLVSDPVSETPTYFPGAQVTTRRELMESCFSATTQGPVRLPREAIPDGPVLVLVDGQVLAYDAATMVVLDVDRANWPDIPNGDSVEFETGVVLDRKSLVVFEFVDGEQATLPVERRDVNLLDITSRVDRFQFVDRITGMVGLKDGRNVQLTSDTFDVSPIYVNATPDQVMGVVAYGAQPNVGVEQAYETWQAAGLPFSARIVRLQSGRLVPFIDRQNILYSPTT